MSEYSLDQPPADPAQFGTWLAWKTKTEQEAKAAALADLSQFRPVSAYLTRSTHGIMGAATGQQQAAEVAARRPRTGDASGAGRELEYLGGTDWESQGAGSVGPIVPRRYLRSAQQEGGLGYDPLASYRQSRGQ